MGEKQGFLGQEVVGEIMGRGGFEPPTHGFSVSAQDAPNRLKTQALTKTPSADTATPSVTSVQQDPDLAAVVAAWKDLPDSTKNQITNLVRNGRTG